MEVLSQNGPFYLLLKQMKRPILILLLLITIKGFSQSIACQILHNIDGSIKLIKDSAYVVANPENGDNKCVISLVDSLRTRFIKTHKTEYLDCLDSICFNCSDEVGEKFGDTIIFYHAFKPYIDYLFTRGDTNNCLTLSLLAGFGFDEMDDDNDLFYAKKRLDSFIIAEEKEFKFSEAEKKFIELIRHYAENPGMDDDE